MHHRYLSISVIYLLYFNNFNFIKCKLECFNKIIPIVNLFNYLFQMFNNLIQWHHVDIWTWGHEVILWFHWLHCSYCFHWFHCSIYFIIVNKLNFLTWIINFNFIYLILLIWNYLLWQYFYNLNVSVFFCVIYWFIVSYQFLLYQM